ncbi:uncharacterized protein Tco025E_10234 [Trypanosoma conorhini]|uniref:Mucin-associated surface protein (MASP) n=1 Tax=Trypanosoma conorhini TaxID=83891 RepID=A0A422MPB2_9TRYP|nr:uncharacterized protein Tco025E_10234 [Trypanosoma conorhini]RNE95051.1 hypothetical protein Tco025E_10234 [Trypanosoma conorhini]
MNIMDREEGGLHKWQGTQAGGATPQSPGSRVGGAGEAGVCPLTAAPEAVKEEEADALKGTAGRDASPQPQTDGQPQGGAAAQAATTTNSTSAAKAAPGDSDGSSTAASDSASLFAVLLLLAYAAAAAVVAA